MTGDASQLINLKWKPDGFVTYGGNNRGRILGVSDIGGDDNVIIRCAFSRWFKAQPTQYKSAVRQRLKSYI